MKRKAPDHKPVPEGSRTYNSPLMVARRQRILEEVLKLIEESGVERITIREIARRSGVAPRTLYTAFGRKEELIAQAIRQHFQESMGENSPLTAPDSLHAVSARLDMLAHVVIRQRHYSSVLAAIYFSPTIDPRIYEILKEIGLSHIRLWVTILVAEKRLNASSPRQIEFLLSQLANAEYNVINDWGCGRLTDAQLAPHLKLAVLLLIRGYLNHDGLAPVTAAIKALWRSAGLVDAMGPRAVAPRTAQFNRKPTKAYSSKER